ncbi:MAG: penicillin-binding protein 2 [Chloroflexi bacterium]|nr:penicillin-binding protein 2 [Chloroflexota bacterium]
MELFQRRRRWRAEKPKKNEPPPGSRKGVFAILRLLVVVLFLILSVQLIRLQILQGDEYEERAAINALREVPVSSARGLIFDRNGRPLVRNIATFAAAVVPGDLPSRNETQVYRQLSQVIEMPVGEIVGKVQEHLEDRNPYDPVIVKENLGFQKALVLRELEPYLPGVKLVTQATRQYTAGLLTSHVLGYVGAISAEEYAKLKDDGYLLNDRVGKTGVELVYEALLRGRPGKKLVEVDAAGHERKLILEKRPLDGSNLVLTIDLQLQKRLRDTLAQYAAGSEGAAAVVMDVDSGEILAMVSLPEFDNNIFSGPLRPGELQRLIDAPGKPLVNHTIAEMYPPGSTFKTVVGAAALQEGVATPSTTIVSRGYITVTNQYDPNVVYVYKDWAALGALDFYGGIAMSSDVYFYYLAGGKADEGFVGLGEQRLARYARTFGLGQPTGIDLPGESPGLVPDAIWKEETIGEPWFVGDTYNFGIGQGYLAVTPLQLLTAVSTIANGGEVLEPHLLHEVQDSHGNVVEEAERTVRRRVPVDPGYLEIVTEAMRQSVSRGVATTAAVAGLEVAGKTGTAEFGSPLGDGTHDTHGWFVGFAPYDDPQVAIVVFVQRGGGGQDAAPVAADILDYMFNGSNLAQKLETGR